MRRKPRGLGSFEPEPGSVTWRSHWRVDPRRAALGYAAVLLVGAAAAGWLCATLSDEPPPLDARRAYLLRMKRGIAPTLLTVFGCLMAFGTTKRCFGFGRATAAHGALSLAALVALAYVDASPLVAGVLGAVLALAPLPLSSEHARRGGAIVGYLALAHLAWRCALLAYDLSPPRGDERLVLRAAWFALGAAPGAALVLLTRRS